MQTAGVADRPNWPVVFACFCTGVFSWGFGFYGPAVYLAELQRLHGWSAALISSATTAYYLVSAALLPLVHTLVARAGPRAVLAGGAAVLGIGAAGLAHAAAPWQMFAGYMVMAAGWVCTSSAALSTVIAIWFDRRRGLAISLALNGASVAGFTVAPLMVQLNHAYDFPTVTAVLAAVLYALLLPVVLLGVRGPAGGDPRPADRRMAATPAPQAATRRAVLRQPRFWTLTVPYACGLTAQVGYLMHQVAFLLPSLGPRSTGLAVGFASVAAMAGRIGFGFIGDRLDQRIAGAGLLVNQAAALLLMLAFHGEPAILWLGSVMFGLSVGSVITLPAMIVQREFPAAAFGITIGLLSAFSQITYAFGPALLGWLRDLAAGYGPALMLCMALELGGAAILAGGRLVERRRAVSE